MDLLIIDDFDFLICYFLKSQGQFSSSPIENSTRKYSLGSITSPPTVSLPTFSPIALEAGKTPLSGRSQNNIYS